MSEQSAFSRTRIALVSAAKGGSAALLSQWFIRVFHVLLESQTQPETLQFQLLRLALPVQSEPEVF